MLIIEKNIKQEKDIIKAEEAEKKEAYLSPLQIKVALFKRRYNI
ncbi:hypothetical protein [Sporocytophaga myxococcoides]|nr:hypothetical protein [Sporocytophaga myxococcoides]